MDTVLQPIQKRPLYREEIKEALRQAILSGQLKPGDRIVETKWAKLLGVSQSPVREAIRELETVGLVENIPYQGAFVKTITRKDLKDSYYVRMALEQLGIKDAVAGITDEQLLPIKQALDAMEQAADRHDFDDYIKKDVLFHQLIMEVSKNELLLRLWDQCNIREWTHVGTQFSDQTLEILARRHESIYEALVARDAVRGQAEARKHLEELIEELDQQEAET